MIGKILEIIIAKDKTSKTVNLDTAEAVKGKGLLNDRYYKDNNKNINQITLIEIENINHYNNLSSSSILPKDFRRNIVTQDIKLNDLVGKEFYLGIVKLKAHDLCRPCKNLQESLKQTNLVKKLISTGGLRCEILSSGKININDKITLRKND